MNLARKSWLLGVLILLCGYVHAAEPAPELEIDGPVLAPIEFGKWFEGPQKLYGYAPRFVPNAVTFDAQNRPYMMKWDDDTGGGAAIQTMDADGTWELLDFPEAVKAIYPEWDGRFLTGVACEMRVVFDDDNDAYVIMDARESNIEKVLLLHSRDLCRNFDIYELPCKFARLEFAAGANDMSRPPVICGRAIRTNLYVFAPTKNADGTLTIPEPVNVAGGLIGGALPSSSGASNVSATRGDITHIVWAGRYAVEGEKGTPQYCATYNRVTGEVTEPVLLGAAGRNLDNHNLPGVCMDSAGYLHVVLGAHGGREGQCFRYAKSVTPQSVKFEPAENMESGYTYVGLLCGPDDTLHLIARKHGLPYTLRYLRKRPGENWSEDRILLQPYREDDTAAFYNNFYHKINMDRKGRLFVSYWYYSHVGSDEQTEAYRQKWPEDVITGNAETGWKYESLQPHAPGMLISDDGGDTWRLCVSQDFVDGFDG